MKRYSILHAFVLSFFSKSFYQDVRRHWRGTGLGYLFVILVLVWIPTMIKMQWGLTRFVNNEAPRLTQQVPRITITKGQVSTDVATPYFIKGDDGTPLMIIDTTGQYQTLDDTPAYVLLTKTKIITRDERQTRSYDLAPVESFEVDRTRVEGWLQVVKDWLALAAFPLLLVFSFIFRAIQVLIYAAIGLLFARILNTNLNYQTLMRLAAVSLTPVLVLNLLLEFVPFHIPLWWLLGTAVGLGYLFFAVKANDESEVTTGYQPPPTPQNPLA